MPCPAVDTTPTHHAGRWWLFTTILESRSYAMALMLFSSYSLDGGWLLHPRNPISVNVRTARGAGSIFREDGRLFRPSQDCSRGYGHAFSINEITGLSPTKYEEEQRIVVGPDWSPGLVGTHTYNRAGDWEVADGKVPRALPQASLDLSRGATRNDDRNGPGANG